MKKDITPMDLKVIDCLTQGMSNKEIGKELHRSTRTIKSHIHNISLRLGIATESKDIRIKIAVMYYRKQLCLPESPSFITMMEQGVSIIDFLTTWNKRLFDSLSMDLVTRKSEKSLIVKRVQLNNITGLSSTKSESVQDSNLPYGTSSMKLTESIMKDLETY